VHHGHVEVLLARLTTPTLPGASPSIARRSSGVSLSPIRTAARSGRTTAQTHWSIADLAQYIRTHPELGLGTGGGDGGLPHTFALRENAAG
jgi:hypothetical protein